MDHELTRVQDEETSAGSQSINCKYRDTSSAARPGLVVVQHKTQNHVNSNIQTNPS